MTAETNCSVVRVAATLLLVAALPVAPVAAQITQAWSVNLAGVMKVTLPSGTLTQATMPFQPLDDPLHVTNVIGAQLPQGAAIYVWDITSNSYRSANRMKSGWSPTTLTFRPGEGFWLDARSLTSTTSEVFRVYLAGEVPSSETQSSAVITPITGLDLIGFAYPMSIPFTNTTLYDQGELGDRILVWRTESQDYVTNILTASGWVPPVTGLVLTLGMDFWYGTSNELSWTESKPYTWP